jgi:hypothetical protein
MSFTGCALWSFIDTASCDSLQDMNVPAHRLDTSWVTVSGTPDSELARALFEKIEALRTAGEFSETDQAHISKLSFSVTRDGFKATPERVELLQRLCQIYSADIRPQAPTSHRKIIGPFIVFGKKMLQPVVNAVFGPALRNQREFNASVVSLLTDLCNDGAKR